MVRIFRKPRSPVSLNSILTHRVIPPGGIGQYNDTGIPLSLRYGDGSYGVDGTIGLAPFEFGPYKIDRQGLELFTLCCVFSLILT